MTELLSLSVAMFAGLLMTRPLSRFHLPDVTAYLIAGVLIGPCCLGLLHIPGLGFGSFEELEGLKLISNVALGFIAFSIGNEFRLSQLRETGRQALVIGILQAVAATLLVDLALLLFHLLRPDVLSVPAAITLGAIAAATAPAATLMVVRQYKAKGKLTDLLLPIVALDDAVGLVLFAVSFGIAKAIGSGTVDVVGIVVNPLLEILCSLVLGAVAGWLLTQLERLFHSNTNRLAMTIGFVFVTVALSMMVVPAGAATLGFSPLLVLFFVLSGAELELGVFAKASSVLVGLIYIVSRSLGKYYGARESARLAGCDRSVVTYLGITLLPQAGVALGMCVTASSLPGDGKMIRNIVLFAVLVYELVGPLMTKWALTKAGDIRPKSEEVLHRRERKLAAVEAGK